MFRWNDKEAYWVILDNRDTEWCENNAALLCYTFIITLLLWRLKETIRLNTLHLTPSDGMIGN